MAIKKHGKGTSAVKIKNKSSNKKGGPAGKPNANSNRKTPAKRKRDDYEHQKGRDQNNKNDAKRPKFDPSRPQAKGGRAKAAAAAKPQQPLIEETEEVNSEDEQFFKEHSEFVNFFSKIDTKELGADEDHKKAKKKAKEDKTAAREAFYELQSRKNREWDEDEAKEALPVKVGGKLVTVRAPSDDDEPEIKQESGSDVDEEYSGSDNEAGSDFGDDGDDQMPYGIPLIKPETPDEEDDESLTPELKELKMWQQRQQNIAAKKQAIANIAMKIQEIPEQQITKLAELHKYCNDEDITIRKLAILSELAVFQDILPSYRIRDDDEEAEGDVKLSKEVKQLRENERSLLATYQRFLQTIEGFLNNGERVSGRTKRKRGDEAAPAKPKTLTPEEMGKVSLATVAAKAFTELLKTHWHFNYRSNIIVAVANSLNSRHAEISNIATIGMRAMFRSDSKGSACLEAVKVITQVIRRHQYKVRADVIKVLTSIHLTHELEEGYDIFDTKTQPGSKKHLSQKQRKARREEKKLAKELQEQQSKLARDEKKRIQTDILKAIFLLYFRILKKMQNSPLLPSVLEGMARFSHLINVDLLINLLDILKTLVAKDHSKLSLASSLHCVITAFQTLKLQGDVLNIDLKDFYGHFYARLFDILVRISEYETLLPIALRALELMLTQQRLLGVDRIAAYVKRLLIMCLHLPPHSIVAVLRIVYELFKKYPKTQQLLDSEATADGEYLAELDDPEHCNAFASVAWEVFQLTQHYHPVVAQFAKVIWSMEPVVMTSTSVELNKQYDVLLQDFQPALPTPQEHPLQRKISKNSKKGKKQTYFVVPPNEIAGKTSEAVVQMREKCASKVEKFDESAIFTEFFDAVTGLDVISSDEE